MTNTESLPLEGMTVLELDHGLAQYAGRQLAVLGARVIKVEGPDGSQARRSEPRVDGRSVAFEHYNVGKYSVVIDPSSQSGRAELASLIAQADVLLDGWAVGELEEHGFDNTELGHIRPGLVHIQMSQFGATGPWSDRLGSDLIGLAAGGVTASTGYDGVGEEPAQPVAPTGGHTAHFIGIIAATVAVAALSEPRDSGVRTLDLSAHDVIAVSTEIPVSLWEFGKQTVFRHTGRHASAVPYSPEWQFPCADGRYVCAITLYMNDKRFASIIDWFDADGLGEPLRDARFATDAGRTKHMVDITKIMRKFFALHDSEWIFREAQRRQLPWARVQEPQDLVRDAQLSDRGFFTTSTSEDGSERLHPGMPFIGLPSIFTARSDASRLRAPSVGEDNSTLLGDRAITG